MNHSYKNCIKDMKFGNNHTTLIFEITLMSYRVRLLIFFLDVLKKNEGWCFGYIRHFYDSKIVVSLNLYKSKL